jgi:hypothetical protein
MIAFGVCRSRDASLFLLKGSLVRPASVVRPGAIGQGFAYRRREVALAESLSHESCLGAAIGCGDA